MPQRLLRVDAVRIDREAGVLAWKTLFGLRETQPMTHDVHEVGRIAAIEHAERRIEAKPMRVLTHQPIADRVERARPGQAQVVRHLRMRSWPARASAAVMTRCARRVISSAARRVKVSSSMRSGAHARQQQVRDAMRERIRLAGARAGDDQQRPGLHARSFVIAPCVTASRWAAFSVAKAEFNAVMVWPAL